MATAAALPPRTFLRIPLNEWKRKAVHMGAFGAAFALPYLTPLQALLCVIAVFCFNAFLLPRILPSIFRPDAEGKLTGGMEIVLYPAAIWATILIFGFNISDQYCGDICAHQPYQLYYQNVCLVWFFLAIVDGILGLCHQLFFGSPALPWNPRKNWLGLLSGTVLTGLALRSFGFVLDALDGVGFYLELKGFMFALLASMILMLVFALWESVWFGIADNLTLPFLASALWAQIYVRGLGTIDLPDYFPWSLWTAIIPATFALLAFFAKKITLGGAFLGWLIAFLMMLAEPRLFGFLLGFFVLGNLATRFKMKDKAARGIAESRSGRRGAAEIFGAAGMFGWLCGLAWIAQVSEIRTKHWLLVIIAPLIAKTMDTVSSEIGKAVGGKTISLRSFKLVPPGTEGAVSLAGTLAGIAAAALLAALILPLHWGGLMEVAALVGIAILANIFESYWGAWAEPRGMSNGPHTNFLMTLVAATLAWLLWLRG